MTDDEKRIVEWLRGLVSKNDHKLTERERNSRANIELIEVANILANAIERGEHRKD